MPAALLTLLTNLGGGAGPWMGAFNGLLGLTNAMGTGLYLKDSLFGAGGGGEEPMQQATEEDQMEALLREKRKDRQWKTRGELMAMQGANYGR
jgi:hypothetical protein